MPTYEYICQKCNHHFEMFQSMSDKALTLCPEAICPRKKWGKGKVKKMIGAGAGLIFKGSGFYITDYRSEKYKEAAKKDTSGSTTTASAAGSESKGGGESKSSGEAKAPAAAETKKAAPKAETKKAKES
jgi:putative FmdB family regulatory protein